MINFKSSEVICRPAGQVFDFLSTPENDARWHYGTLAASTLTEGIPSKGTFFRSIGHWMGRRNLSTFEVTEYKPDQKYGYKSLSGPLSSQTSYSLGMMDNGCTKIEISIQADVVNFFQMDEGTLEKKMKKQLKEDLAILKDLLEAESFAG
ncbi:MAG TPA: SRPBCC family protein [Anaerolineales bacterium]|nr:SRPBCC family protein [Anaerolineales bacterium]